MLSDGNGARDSTVALGLKHLSLTFAFGVGFVECAPRLADPFPTPLVPSGHRGITAAFSRGNFLLELVIARKTVRVQRAPTMFGPVSFTIRSQLDDGVVEAEVAPPTRQPPKRLDLRLRVPLTHKLQSVLVNGRQHTQVDLTKAAVSLSGLTGTMRIKAMFTRITP